MAGASVGLASRDGAIPLFGYWFFGPGRGPHRDALEALIHPAAVTGPDGVARFTGLFPGDYELAVAERGSARVEPWVHDQGLVIARAPGLGVAEGRETAFTMAIHPQPCTVQLQVLRPDGKPVADRSVSFSIVRGPRPSAMSLALDGQGMASYTFPSPGLWGIDVRFRDSEMKSFPITAEPYFQAEAPAADRAGGDAGRADPTGGRASRSRVAAGPAARRRRPPGPRDGRDPPVPRSARVPQPTRFRREHRRPGRRHIPGRAERPASAPRLHRRADGPRARSVGAVPGGFRTAGAGGGLLRDGHGDAGARGDGRAAGAAGRLRGAARSARRPATRSPNTSSYPNRSEPISSRNGGWIRNRGNSCAARCCLARSGCNSSIRPKAAGGKSSGSRPSRSPPARWRTSSSGPRSRSRHPRPTRAAACGLGLDGPSVPVERPGRGRELGRPRRRQDPGVRRRGAAVRARVTASR